MAEHVQEFPEPALRDRMRVGADAAIAAVPWVGGSIQVLADSVLAPSLQKRRDRWMREVGQLLNELADKVDGFDPEQLAGNDVFVTAMVTASRIAIGTHLEEKLEMLKNCLAHLAVRDHDSDEFIDMLFFRYVDELSPEHLVLLRYQQDPVAWFQRHEDVEAPNVSMGKPLDVMKRAGFPFSTEVLTILLRDLSERDLSENVGGTMTAAGIWAKRSTSLGDRLLAFVTEI